MCIEKKMVVAAALALCAAGMTAAKTSADVVYSDNFESDTLGASPAGWTASTTASNMVVSTVADATTSSQAMDVDQLTAGTRYVSLTLPTAVTLADGASVTLSFDLRLVTDPATLTAADRAFRFGLYNTDNEGYIARLDVGAASGNSGDVWASHAILDASSADGSSDLGISTAAGMALDDNTVHNVVLTLTRSGAAITESLSMADNGGTPVTVSGTDTTTTIPTDIAYTFDKIVLGQSGSAGQALDYHIDNVVVSTSASAVPEPASLGLLGVGALAMLRRRRKA